ncbi:hypothetical protein D6201_03475 [Aurantiacibacter aquimixticola]|uniref:Uncharacterized protein n=1 Tax=Aurantiacibacter aquimixticola TaxID=1958945 RepID=A0A419RRZ5_9SPHN|nr:hypothetical protein D6201_03475 [Aurantiacibacter aquimixticola]
MPSFDWKKLRNKWIMRSGSILAWPIGRMVVDEAALYLACDLAATGRDGFPAMSKSGFDKRHGGL